MKIFKRISCIFLTIVIISNLISCNALPSQQDEYTRMDFTAFDTICSITVFGMENIEAYRANEEAFNINIKMIIDKLEKIFSRTDPESELYKLNHRKTNEVMISRQLALLFDAAKQMYSWSVGYFDISIGNLSELWDVKNRKNLPTAAEIEEALSHARNMDYEISFDVEPNDLLSDKIVFNGDMNTHYDLGALAKGYAALNIRDVLEETLGVTSGIINFGGSVTIIGEKGNEPYRIGIRRPFKEGYIITEEVVNKSLITSGTYERYFEYNGKVYSHIISNETGYPVDNELTSATIICDNPVMGDFLSTSILILGKERGKILLETIRNNLEDKELAAIVIDKDENIERY